MFRHLLFLPAVLIATCPVQQFHKATYHAGWDIHFSPYAGGENLLFLNRAVERAEGYYIAKGEICYSLSPSARFWRINELFLGWLPLNYLATVAQHEVFGHGYRIRDIHRGRAKVDGYSIEVPPPYGSGGGATGYHIGERLTTTEENTISSAGVESTAILAQLTKFKWLESNWIDPRTTALYLLSQHDLNLYIGTLDTNDEELDGHDIHMYIKSLNQTYTNHFLSKSKLKALSWINLADPFTYYSVYAWFRYVVCGKETHIPMIPIYDFGYLPTVRLGLTPFGPEYFIENYLLKGHKPIYFYLKGGHHSQNKYAGLGLYAPKLWSLKKWFIGLRFDAWRQPKLLLTPTSIPFSQIDFDAKPDKNNPLYSYSQQHDMRFGGAGSIVIAYQNKSGFEAELGYKSSGFLPGYALRKSPTARIYYSLRF
ncbi:MAG: hypothetical protein COT85_02175 [Chlamydiae bacterium CG10_big_fil_rev_8_21_14_0_10_42_34]|nr:MAG: hypothetical protein COT85_02175 [Chlamydiae bacterium CG10_big_fil_rev_8_21_14_0_10_42_34]